MGVTVVGIDPDSNRHGVAVYVEGKLQALHMMNLPELRRWMDGQGGELLFSIEDVLAQNFVYTRNAQASRAAQAKVGVSIGRCQQAQAEVVRELEDRGVRFELHRPTICNWANNKKEFERFTGWSGRSNSETRSAAYFGFIAARDQGRKRGRYHVRGNRGSAGNELAVE